MTCGDPEQAVDTVNRVAVDRANTPDVTTLREIVEIIWQGKWLVIGITLLVTFITGLTAVLTPRTYIATVLLSVVSNRGGGGLGGGSSVLSQFGGIASLAGLSLHGDSEKSEAVAILQSDTLTMRYISDHDLLPVLYSKEWDPLGKQWRGSDPQKRPTLWRANEKFKGNVREVTESSKTGLISLTITWTDPHLAAQWANDLVKLANDYMRDKAIAESERNIAYLNDQAAKTDISQVRTAVYAILESEIRRAMIARGTEEYALRVLDPAVTPERPSAPKRTIWVIVGFVAGLFVSIFIVLVRESWTRSGRARGH
jgi:uncharacterized protein involved in exopolysaccharide biosynthesis